MASLRKLVLDAVVVRLNTIETGAGYATDLSVGSGGAGAKLSLAGLSAIGSGPAGAVVAPTGGRRVSETQPWLEEQLEIAILCWTAYEARDGDDGLTPVEALLTDVQKAVGTDDTLGGLVNGTFIQGWQLSAPPTNNVSAITVTYEVPVKYDWSDPEVPA